MCAIQSAHPWLLTNYYGTVAHSCVYFVFCHSFSLFLFFPWVHARACVQECACVWEGSNICVWSMWRCVGVQNPMVFLGSLRPHACRGRWITFSPLHLVTLIRLPLTALLSGWHRIKDVYNWLGKAVINSQPRPGTVYISFLQSHAKVLIIGTRTWSGVGIDVPTSQG